VLCQLDAEVQAITFFNHTTLVLLDIMRRLAAFAFLRRITLYNNSFVLVFTFPSLVSSHSKMGLYNTMTMETGQVMMMENGVCRRHTKYMAR